jgi:hypothetical protein
MCDSDVASSGAEPCGPRALIELGAGLAILVVDVVAEVGERGDEIVVLVGEGTVGGGDEGPLVVRARAVTRAGPFYGAARAYPARPSEGGLPIARCAEPVPPQPAGRISLVERLPLAAGGVLKAGRHSPRGDAGRRRRRSKFEAFVLLSRAHSADRVDDVGLPIPGRASQTATHVHRRSRAVVEQPNPNVGLLLTARSTAPVVRFAVHEREVRSPHGREARARGDGRGDRRSRARARRDVGQHLGGTHAAGFASGATSPIRRRRLEATASAAAAQYLHRFGRPWARRGPVTILNRGPTDLD